MRQRSSTIYEIYVDSRKMATDNKYDRQLRLWGGSGQRALMEANILLVNASATGTETLKNLVLPGDPILQGEGMPFLFSPFRTSYVAFQEDRRSLLIRKSIGTRKQTGLFCLCGLAISPPAVHVRLDA